VQGAKVNLPNNRGETSLLCAYSLFCVCGSNARNPGIVNLLIAHGANVNAADQHGNTPLMKFACTSGSYAPRILNILLAHHAAVNARNQNGESALHVLNVVAEEDVTNAEYLAIRHLLLNAGAKNFGSIYPAKNKFDEMDSHGFPCFVGGN